MGGMYCGEILYLLQKKEPDVHFFKEEHVIPAGLGGIHKLPLGSVADEVNEAFSPIELKALRSSLVGVRRERSGPGKRGSLNVNKIKKPRIRIIKDEYRNQEIFKLGFLFMEKTYTIPQIEILFNDEENSFISVFLAMNDNIQQGKKEIIDFRNRLKWFLKSKSRQYIMIPMPYETDTHFITVGEYNNQWYAATSHKIINMDYLSFMLLEDKSILEFGKKEEIFPHKQEEFRFEFDFQIDAMLFLYVKTAFNALSFLLGVEIAHGSEFDQIRNKIMDKEQIESVVVKDSQVNSKVKERISGLKNEEHYIVIYKYNESIFAWVGFYGEKQGTTIKLSENYSKEVVTQGLICDWKNREENIVILDTKVE